MLCHVIFGLSISIEVLLPVCHVIFVLSISIEVLLCGIPCDFWFIHISRGPAMWYAM